jgi:hypothetical protein
MGFTPSLLKKWMTERCSSLVHVINGAAIFTLLLYHRVAFLHCTATSRPLSNHEYHCCHLARQLSYVSNFYHTFKVLIWLSYTHTHTHIYIHTHTHKHIYTYNFHVMVSFASATHSCISDLSLCHKLSLDVDCSSFVFHPCITFIHYQSLLMSSEWKIFVCPITSNPTPLKRSVLIYLHHIILVNLL